MNHISEVVAELVRRVNEIHRGFRLLTDAVTEQHEMILKLTKEVDGLKLEERK